LIWFVRYFEFCWLACPERGLGAVMIKLLNTVNWLSGFNILEPGVCPYFSKKSYSGGETHMVYVEQTNNSKFKTNLNGLSGISLDMMIFFSVQSEYCDQNKLVLHN
jgi:hypothetical protein